MMKRLPSSKRNNSTHLEIEAARKQQRQVAASSAVYKDEELEHLHLHVEEQAELYANGAGPSSASASAAASIPNGCPFPSRRLRTVRRAHLFREAPHYRRPYASNQSRIRLEVPWIGGSGRFQSNQVEYDGEVIEYQQNDEEEDLEDEEEEGANHEEVQEQIDVVDGVELTSDSMHLNAPFHYGGGGSGGGYGGAAVDLQAMFRQAASTDWQGGNDEMMEHMVADPAMSYPLDVLSLIRETATATPEQNAQTIVSLAMQINYLKGDMTKLRREIGDLRSACLNHEQSMYSSRKFSPMAPCSREHWRIPAAPPLREVDLLKEARSMNTNSGGKRMLRIRDSIGRFVKIALDRLIPEHLVRDYTVKDRGQSSQTGPKDIGQTAKDQITGIVLDLMGLYNTQHLDGRGRTDRAMITQLVNKCMKAAIYDKRRIAPKRKVQK